MLKGLILTATLILGASAAAARPTAAVKIDFNYSNFSKAKIELYEAQGSAQFNISQTGLVKDLKDAPVDGPLTGPVKLEIPGQKTFVLVMRNKTAKDLFFFASPHTLHPQEHSLGHYFECLCIHHVFRVPAGQIWYRVVRLNLDEEGRVAPASITHTIIGLTEAQVKKDYPGQIYNYGSGAGVDEAQ